MKNLTPPTGVERVMRDDDFIVSKTDPSGRLTYGNRTFIAFSGFSEAELLGQQHNIIRHPDMPRGVFALMWQTLQAQREFNGYVKNMAKDGSHYWVFANITPDQDAQRHTTGYFSVRRKPSKDAVTAVSALYREMLEAERRAGTRDAVAASTKVLRHRLGDTGLSYDEFVLAL